MAAKEEDEVYCVCRKPYSVDDFMIECDKCNDWFHGSCVGVEEYQSHDIETYHCPNCQSVHGPLTLKRRRNWHRHDYSEMNDGKNAVQSGTVIFIDKLKKMKFPSSEEVVLRPQGSELSMEWFNTHGFDTPMIVEEPAGLGLKVPPSTFTIPDVERYVGSLRELDAIDVARQDDIKLKMREWVEYHSSLPRKKVLNVISLEFSDTPLNELVDPPTIVQQMDWINVHWPNKVPEDSPQRPRVQKYCLMGTKDSYTDFHVDFGGTSVWYHIVWGEKIFYIIPPTDENLLLYEQWVLSANQSEIFFGSRVKNCYRVHVLPGNTLFIPSGWIHAVLTPIDSLVFGGNFLHQFGIGLQTRIYDMELRLHTPEKFLHPSYETLCWYAAKNYHKELLGHIHDGSQPLSHLLKELSSLTDTLEGWTHNKGAFNLHEWAIPNNVRPHVLITQLKKALKLLKGAQSNDLSFSEEPSREPIKLHLSTSRISKYKKEFPVKEPITLKLTLPQTKRKKREVIDNKEEEEEEQSTDDEKEQGDFIYKGLVGRDDAGAVINDKEDRLWRPTSSYKSTATSTAISNTDYKRLKVKTEDNSNETKKQHRSDFITTIHKSKPPKTTKQRLGKILGLDRTGHFLKK